MLPGVSKSFELQRDYDIDHTAHLLERCHRDDSAVFGSVPNRLCERPMDGDLGAQHSQGLQDDLPCDQTSLVNSEPLQIFLEIRTFNTQVFHKWSACYS